MGFIRKTLAAILTLLFLILPVEAAAAEMDMEDYAQLMVQYYLAYQEQADAEIKVLRDNINDPWLEEMWHNIMDSWTYNNYHMPIYEDVLPDGLPLDDSLCIVIMGYGLNPDGSMQPELIGRLETALACAVRYPNAYVLCTGGGTAKRCPEATEAGRMGE